MKAVTGLQVFRVSNTAQAASRRPAGDDRRAGLARASVVVQAERGEFLALWVAALALERHPLSIEVVPHCGCCDPVVQHPHQPPLLLLRRRRRAAHLAL